MLYLEIFLDLRVILDRELIVRRPSYVEPEAVMLVDVDQSVVLEAIPHQSVEAIPLTFRKFVDDALGKAINADSHMVRVDRLLLERHEPILIIEYSHSELYLHFPVLDHGRNRVFLFDMQFQKLAIVDITERVAVYDEEVIRKILYEGYRTDRVKRLRLARIIDLDSPFRSVPSIVHDHLGKMVDRERQMRKSLLRQLPYKNTQHRLVLRDRDEWLWNLFCMR